jgi:hypothetical protein
MSTTVSISAVGQKPVPVPLSTTEGQVDIVSTTHPKPWVVQLLCSAAWTYNSVANQADPMPVAANQPLCIAMRDAATFTFYAAAAAGTPKLHVLVLQ